MNSSIANFRKASAIVSAAVLLALSSATVTAAGTQTKKSPSKEEAIGMASGTAIGALIGGPFGAAVGFIVGTVAGTGTEQVRATAKHAKKLENELTDARLALSKFTEEQQHSEPRFDQLAQQLRGDVLFRTNSAELDANAGTKLAELGAVLAAYPSFSIELDGFADPRGESQGNMELSQRRAAAVRAALIVGGAQSERIKIAAHGAELSTAVKGDLEAYAWERRVSLSIVPSEQTDSLAQAR